MYNLLPLLAHRTCTYTVPKVKRDDMRACFIRLSLPGDIIVNTVVSAKDSTPSASRPLSPLDKGPGVPVCALASWPVSRQCKIHYRWSQGAECKPDPATSPTGACAQWTIMMSLEAPDHKCMGCVPHSPLLSCFPVFQYVILSLFS